MDSMVDLVNSITHAAAATPVSVPIIFKTPSGSPIPTVGNWMDPRIFEAPDGAGFQRGEGSHFMSVLIADIPSAPRGSVVVAPEVSGGLDKTWSVERSEPIVALGTRILILVETP